MLDTICCVLCAVLRLVSTVHLTHTHTAGDWDAAGCDGYENDFSFDAGGAAAGGDSAGLSPWAAAALGGGGSGGEGGSGLPSWMSGGGSGGQQRGPEALTYEELCR